jgi:hypothetical protein
MTDRWACEIAQWEQECAALARSIYKMSKGEPLAHIQTLSGEALATLGQVNVWKQKLELFRRYHTLNMFQRNQWGSSLTSEAQKMLRNIMYEMGYIGSGRNYVSTKGGRLGFAP